MEIVDLSELESQERLQTPLYPARAGWSFNREEIIRAMDYLYIEAPIKLRYQSGRRTIGVHGIRFIPEAGAVGHRITVNQNQTIVNANNTLWHELTHASQAARMVRETGLSLEAWHRDAEHGYDSGKGPWGKTYDGNKFEIEANAMARQMEVNWLLLK